MRVVQNPQMQLGELDLSQIKFNLKSRDDIPRILRGLQFLYMDVSLRKNIFALLEKRFAPCLLYTSPSPRDGLLSRMPSSA